MATTRLVWQGCRSSRNVYRNSMTSLPKMMMASRRPAPVMSPPTKSSWTFFSTHSGDKMTAEPDPSDEDHGSYEEDEEEFDENAFWNEDGNEFGGGKRGRGSSQLVGNIHRHGEKYPESSPFRPLDLITPTTGGGGDRSFVPLENARRICKVPPGTIHPLAVTFSCADVMRDCCRLGTRNGLVAAHSILERVLAEKRHQENDNDDFGPLVVQAKFFEILLFGWASVASRFSREAMERTVSLLDLMATEHEYDVQIQSEHQSTSESAPTEPSADLLYNDDSQKKRNERTCQPSVISYNIFLFGLVKASPYLSEAAPQAAALLDQMRSLHETKCWHTKPNTRSYTHVISAFAKSKVPDAGRQAERILREMGRVHQMERKDKDYRAEKQIVTPDTVAYSQVISAYANSTIPGSPRRAEEILLELVNHPTQSPDAVAFTNAIHAWANVAAASSRSRAGAVVHKPHHRFNAAERAERLLSLLIDLSQQHEQPPSQGDEDGACMNPLTPTVVTYNAVLSAWAKSDTREAAPRAEALLRRMLESQDGNHILPNEVSFRTVISAWARFSKYDPDSPTNAEGLLNLMYDLYYHSSDDENDDERDSLLPTTATYCAVINAWARSVNPNKAQEARRLLDTMAYKYESGETNMKPNVVAYTSVLNAILNSPQDQGGEGELWSMALRTYQELKEDRFVLEVQPDALVYANMIQIVGRHLHNAEELQRSHLEQIFDDACAMGQVDANVVRVLHDACPTTDVLHRLLGQRRPISNLGELPADWTQNVRKVNGGRIFPDKSSHRNSPNNRYNRPTRSNQEQSHSERKQRNPSNN